MKFLREESKEAVKGNEQRLTEQILRHVWLAVDPHSLSHIHFTLSPNSGKGKQQDMKSASLNKKAIVEEVILPFLRRFNDKLMRHDDAEMQMHSKIMASPSRIISIEQVPFIIKSTYPYSEGVLHPDLTKFHLSLVRNQRDSVRSLTLVACDTAYKAADPTDHRYYLK